MGMFEAKLPTVLLRLCAGSWTCVFLNFWNFFDISSVWIFLHDVLPLQPLLWLSSYVCMRLVLTSPQDNSRLTTKSLPPITHTLSRSSSLLDFPHTTNQWEMEAACSSGAAPLQVVVWHGDKFVQIGQPLQAHKDQGFLEIEGAPTPWVSLEAVSGSFFFSCSVFFGTRGLNPSPHGPYEKDPDNDRINDISWEPFHRWTLSRTKILNLIQHFSIFRSRNSCSKVGDGFIDRCNRWSTYKSVCKFLKFLNLFFV